MNKKVLRKRLIEIRKNIRKKNEKSSIIMQKITKLEIFKEANVIALYNSLENEVNTNYLIDYAQKCGKKILLPRVIGDNLLFFEYQKNDILERSIFNIMEPMYNKDNIYKGKIDLIIVPGVGFDQNNNRLGYGKGFYDHFLKNKNIFKIGICFKEQLLDEIPVNEYDIKMDLIITN